MEYCGRFINELIDPEDQAGPFTGRWEGCKLAFRLLPSILDLDRANATFKGYQ